jgi:hypothetical protein
VPCVHTSGSQVAPQRCWSKEHQVPLRLAVTAIRGFVIVFYKSAFKSLMMFIFFTASGASDHILSTTVGIFR